MLEASCHCGAVRFQVPVPPLSLTACNCSLCRRLGTLMVPYHPSQLRFISSPGATVPYIQGDKTLATHHCSTCGCTTHAEGLGEYAEEWMKVNALLFDPTEIKHLQVRHFDGADSWTFLD